MPSPRPWLPAVGAASLGLGLALSGRLPADQALSFLDPASAPWLEILASARARGVTGTLLRLPVPGDVRGIHPLPDLALEVGGIVGLTNQSEVVAWLVPDVPGTGAATVARWRETPAGSPSAAHRNDVTEADQHLRQVLLESLQQWEGRDLMAAGPQDRAEIERDVRRWIDLPWDQTTGSRVAPLERASRILCATSIAMSEVVGVTSADLEARDAILTTLARAARDCVEACCSVGPPGTV